MDKYSISKTTREQRAKIANDALALSTLDASAPSADTLELVNEYIEGNIEIPEILKRVIDKYKE